MGISAGYHQWTLVASLLGIVIGHLHWTSPVGTANRYCQQASLLAITDDYN